VSHPAHRPATLADPVAVWPVLGVGSELLPALRPEQVLGVVRYGSASAAPAWAELSVDLPPVAGTADSEVWLSGVPVSRGELGPIRYGHNGSVLFAGYCCREQEGETPEQVTYRIYRQLLQASARLGYRHLLRVWNYFPDINGNLLGLERYQRFSLGRYQAFEEAGYRFDGDLPAASAVGSRAGGDYCVFLLAGKQPGLQIENPRQVSAYRYPLQYGPRSPSFSRATLADWGSEQQLFVSGTASIAGHASLHPGQVEAQLAETLLNIQTLLDQPGLPRRAQLGGLGADAHVKVYLRHADHADRVRRGMVRALGRQAPVLYLQGDICRRDLLLEIEAVVRLR
jgi:chorismate lyase/3-hydroxybenzoate synthase